jgi:hypothetical protein
MILQETNDMEFKKVFCFFIDKRAKEISISYFSFVRHHYFLSHDTQLELFGSNSSCIFLYEKLENLLI